MTLTLPSPGRMLLALVLIAAVFAAAFAVGRNHRPQAQSAVPSLPPAIPASAQSPRITAPSTPPPLPALKVNGPPTVVRSRSVL